MPNIMKANEHEKHEYNQTSVHPLYGYVKIPVESGGKVTCPVERLHGDPDIDYEMLVPRGYIIPYECTHMMLGPTYKELKDRIKGIMLQECDCERCTG